MPSEEPDRPEAFEEEVARGWRRTAAAAGVFSLLVLLLTVAFHLGKGAADPLDTPEFKALKVSLALDPQNESIKERIRVLDLELRRDYFRRRALTRTGGVLLAVALVAFLVAMKRARPRRLPEPGVPETLEIPDDRGREARLRRRAAATMGFLLAAGGGALGFATRDRLPDLDDLRKPSAASATAGFPTLEERRRNWPAFRGHDGSGTAADAEAPDRWNGASGENIRWKAETPLPGASSPVVWEDRVYLTGAEGDRREVFAFDAATGGLAWRSAVVLVGTRPEAPEVEKDTGRAAPTPVTDGRRIAAIFADGVAACFDRDGRQLWSRALGVPDNAYGHASSLALHERLVFVQLDQGHAEDGKSSLLALDAVTGRTAWEVSRPVDASWCSPILVPDAPGEQLVLAAAPWVVAYDPGSGRELWRADCLKGETAPSPVFVAGRLYVAHTDAALTCLRTDGAGDVTGTHVVWQAEEGLPDVCSPLCDGERVYLLASDGELTCIDAGTGETLWSHEFEAPCYSSPARAGDRLYVTTRKGRTFVVRAGAEFEELGRCELGEEVDASPAFAAGRIYWRGKRHLFAVGRR